MSPVRDATSTSTPTGWPGHTSASSRSYPPGGATSWGPRWWGFLSSYLGTPWWQRIDNWKQNKSYVESNEKCVVVNWDFIIGFLFKSNFYWTHLRNLAYASFLIKYIFCAWLSFSWEQLPWRGVTSEVRTCDSKANSRSNHFIFIKSSVTQVTKNYLA